MAIKIGQEFERTSKATRFKDDVMTKAQMLACTDDNYSDGYLVVEKDSHDLYIYDSNATPSAETGKFVKKGPEGTPTIKQVLTAGNNIENQSISGLTTTTEPGYTIRQDMSLNKSGCTINKIQAPEEGLADRWTVDIGVNQIQMSTNKGKTSKSLLRINTSDIENPVVTMSENMKNAWKTTLDINGSGIQVTTLPTASATEEGNIYQYVGATDSNYTNGYFYQCVEVTPATDPKTYEWVQKDVQSGDGVPAGGTTGQILAKNSDDDGDAGWIVDTGKDLNKLVQWGSHTSQSPRTEYVPEITDSTVDHYHRVILHIPIQGSALQGIEATESSLKQYLKTRFKIRYNTELSGTVVFTTTTEDTTGEVPNSFGMKTNLTSTYADSRLYIYLNETTISNNTLHLAVNYYVKFAASQTNHRSKPQNVVLLANDGYTFGVTPVGEPYYVHNSTKIALDDLQINDMNIPTSWGVAKTGNLKMYMTNKQSYQHLWFGNLGFTSVDDYMIFVDITGGMEAAWGKPTVLVSIKSATEAGISLECDSAEATWFSVNYVIIGKGYGNLVSGGGGSVPENIMTARATLGAGDVDIYSMTGTSNEYTPVDDKVTMDLRVIQGGTYSDLPEFNILTAGAGNPIYSKHLATKDYADTELAKKQNTLVSGTNIKTVNNQSLLGSGDIPIPTIVGSDWGVAKQGTVTVSGTTESTVSISDLNLTSASDYQVAITPSANTSNPSYINKSVASFTVKIADNSGNKTLYYTIFAKGYGSVPNGGTTGQALVKKSDTDGDVERKTVSGGGASLTIDTTQVGYGEATISEGGQNLSFTNQNGQGVHIGGISENGEMVTSKSYVDSKSPTIVNEGATFTNAQGNQQMEIRTGGTNSVIIKDKSANGVSEYWSYELPDKPYVDTEVAKRNAVVNFDNEYKTLQIRDVDNKLDFQVVKETSNDYVRMNEYAKDDRGQMQQIFDVNLPTKSYVDSKVGVHMAVGAETRYGTYTDENNVTYQTYTKTVYIPALPSAAGITTYQIGVSNMKQIISISGVTTDGFVLNAPRQNAQDNIAIYQVSKGSQTFSIEVGKDRSSKSAYVTIIYAKNN